MLQGRDVMNWYFYNNYLKVYQNLKSAEKAANKAISKYKFHSVKVYRIYDADEMILTAGSSQGILAALMAVINPGDEIIVTEPTYICYVPDIEMCGGKAVIIPLSSKNDYKLTPEVLEKYITNKTKALFLSYPNNPTGAIMSKKELEAIAPLIITHLPS